MTNQAKRIPPIGARIIKSSIGSAICMLIYFIRELLPIGSGIPFYSILAVLWCIQPYTTSTKSMAMQRAVGTAVGAVYGLVFLLFFRLFEDVSRAVIYLSASVMIIPILYTTVLINKRSASYFSCVVFLSIAIMHSFDDNPYLFVLNRALDTLIGIGVGVLLNSIHHPIRNSSNTIYVSGIDSVLVSRGEEMIPYNKVELNRLIALGAKFTVSTILTPASLMDTMKGIDLKYPVVAMDGAVLYDVKENRYLDVFALDRKLADRAEEIISDMGAHTFVNVLYDNTLIIYYGDFRCEAEQKLFDALRRSPYRNYTHKSFRLNNENERVIYLMTLTDNDRAEKLAKRIGEEMGDKVRVSLKPAPEYKGYTYLKIYDKKACKADMLEILRERTDSDDVVTFGSVQGEYDVYVHDDGGNSAVKALKKLCEGRSIEDLKSRGY